MKSEEEVLDIQVQSRRNEKAALELMHKLLNEGALLSEHRCQEQATLLRRDVT